MIDLTNPEMVDYILYLVMWLVSMAMFYRARQDATSESEKMFFSFSVSAFLSLVFGWLLAPLYVGYLTLKNIEKFWSK